MLHTTSFDQPGACPAAGTHADSPNYEYFLPWSSSQKTGEPGWKVCQRCFGLFDTRATGIKICPAGAGGHSAKGGDEALDFTVCTYDGLGENNWFECANCACMFWSDGGADRAGRCPASDGGHWRSSTSPNFVLDYRTV
jgi:hypothetical protein